MLHEDEARAIRLKAAELEVSMSKLGREVLLAFTRGQLQPRPPQLPGFDEAEKPLPDWLGNGVHSQSQTDR